MQSDINKAKEYSEKALEYIQQNSIVDAKSFVTINNYATELKNRNKEIELIDKQLGN